MHRLSGFREAQPMAAAHRRGGPQIELRTISFHLRRRFQTSENRLERCGPILLVIIDDFRNAHGSSIG